jgi:hypothetical protein
MIFFPFCDKYFGLPHEDGFVKSSVQERGFDIELDYF